MIPYLLTASEDEENIARTTVDVGMLQVAQVYAEAFLNAAEKAGQVDEALEDFEAVVNLAGVPRSDVRQLFVSGVIGRLRRDGLIRKVFDGRANPLLVNFFLVVNDHERVSLLPAILFEARALRDRRASLLPVNLAAAVPLSEDQVERIRQRVRDVLHVEPIIEVKVDPELLGGIQLRVGDWLFDGTVRSYLNALRDQILARSSHEIQSGRDRFSSAIGN